MELKMALAMHADLVLLGNLTALLVILFVARTIRQVRKRQREIEKAEMELKKIRNGAKPLHPLPDTV